MTTYLENCGLRRKAHGNWRVLPCLPSLVDFASNDSLGLARSRRLKEAILTEWSNYESFGASGSRLLTGNSQYFEELEDRIARFHGFEAGIIYNCGYMANLGLLSTIAGSGDTILYDSRIHASAFDGIRLSHSKSFPFIHNDMDHLEKRLQRQRGEKTCFICVESVDSTDGSIAPLAEICKLAEKYEAHIILDEAHATGVCGQGGRGIANQMNLTSKIFVQLVTFSKALGAHGAILLGPRSLKEALINFSNSFIYSTALPFPTLAAIRCSYDIFPFMEDERHHLQRLIGICQKNFKNASRSHIQPIPIHGNREVKAASALLASYGFDIRPLTSPTVRRGDERLRLCLHAFNTEQDLNRLCELIYKEIDR